LNAEFVGQVAAESADSLSYNALSFDLDPPKRGADWPDDWKSVASETVEAMLART
jgi:hypothetical protein